MLLQIRPSIRSTGLIQRRIALPRPRSYQHRNLYVPKNASKRSYSSFNYEKPGNDQASKKGGLLEGATILVGGIFIGWKTRVSYVKHKYGDPSKPTIPEDEEDEYFGLDWTEHPALQVLDLDAAGRKLTASQKSLEFSPNNVNGARRLDTIRFASNSPVEDQLAHASVDIGSGKDGKWDFWGVYDGHAGWATSRVLKQSLIEWVARSITQAPSGSDLLNTIKSAFLDLDNAIMIKAQDALSSSTQSAPEVISSLAPASAGSCALLAIHDPATSKLIVANTGDSRAVLGRRNRPDDENNEEWTAVPLSTDHTGFNPNEVKRMAAAHPGEKSVIDPKTGRVLGIAISRAFGDVRWKWPLDVLNDAQQRYWDKDPRPNYKTPPYLTAEPEITETKVKSGDFLILASDGLWDHISSEDAVRAVGLWVMGQRNPAAMRILTSLSSIGDEAKKDAKPGLPEDWKVTEKDFTLSEGDNAAAHLARQSLGGNNTELFCSVVGLKAPASRNVRDDITVQVVFFGDVIGGK